MKYLIKTLLFIQICIAQPKEVISYNNLLEKSTGFGLERMLVISEGNNAYDFMALGYFINANNNMYLKTKNKFYIDSNFEVLKPILINDDTSNYINNNWRMNVAINNQNAIVNGQEHMISEGYFFRYVGEFLDIIIKNNLNNDYQQSICNGLIYSFTKWKDRSFIKYGDYSLLFQQRLHTGANWAIVALYLNKYDSQNSISYMDFINQFDNQLHKALVLKSENGQKYYCWNSNYPEKFCNALKKIKIYEPIVQDVSHGNHVVLYLLKAKELGNKNWLDFNFDYLRNTLKFKILKSNTISDNVDGSTSNDIENTGWKVSDGWYKLIYGDNSLEHIFRKSLKNYESKIKNSFLELQFNSIYL